MILEKLALGLIGDGQRFSDGDHEQPKRPSMTETTEAIKIHRGLRGVYFDRSPCTFIDGKAGELRYRGYSIHDLAENSTLRIRFPFLPESGQPERRIHGR